MTADVRQQGNLFKSQSELHQTNRYLCLKANSAEFNYLPRAEAIALKRTHVSIGTLCLESFIAVATYI